MQQKRLTELVLPVLITMLLFISCKQESSTRTKQTDNIVIATDSSMLDMKNYTIKKIHIGDKITDIPLCSQIASIQGKDKYLMLDEDFIYIFDWDSGEKEDSIMITKCGILRGYSGFNYLSKDSILICHSDNRTVFLIDSDGQVKNQWRLPRSENPEQWLSSVESLNASRIQSDGNNILVSGSILGNLCQAEDMKIPVSEYADMATGTWKTTVSYPEKYTSYNWGGIYMNNVYITKDALGNYLYSFPIMDTVLKFNSDFSLCDTLYMKSRYDKGIEECNLSMEEIDDDDTQDIRYFISQLSYSHIMYDNYRDLYLRVVKHPLQNWNEKEVFTQPISVIITDTKGEILSESSITKDYRKLYYNNMHICRDGLAISMKSSDDEYIHFACFKIEL